MNLFIFFWKEKDYYHDGLEQKLVIATKDYYETLSSKLIKEYDTITYINKVCKYNIY